MMTTPKKSFIKKVGFMESSLCSECTNCDEQITQQIKRMEIKEIKILNQDKQKIIILKIKYEKP